jgi:uncharacterized surface protein with fasciclin (FAS1) repeats
MPDLIQAARAFGLFRGMTTLLERTGMSTLLVTPCPFTLLMPLDDAFEAIAPDGLEAWARGYGHDGLIALLSRHMLPGRWPVSALGELGEARTHHDERLHVLAGARLAIGGAVIVQADIRADNGLLHVVDRVLVGPDVTGACGAAAADRAGEAPRA